MKRRERGIQPLTPHPPRPGRVRHVIGPLQVVAELVHPAVDEDPVLRRSGAVRPLPADLQRPRRAVHHAATRAPVPGGRVPPTTPPAVEDRPAGPEVLRRAVDGHRPGDGIGQILEGVLEPPLTPRDHHREAVVPRAADLELDPHTARLHTDGGGVLVVVDLDGHPTPTHAGRSAQGAVPRFLTERRPVERPDPAAALLPPRVPIQDVDRAVGQIVQPGDRQTDHGPVVDDPRYSQRLVSPDRRNECNAGGAGTSPRRPG